jgi:hypothetical protein
LWRRVVKLNDVVTTYANSTFVQDMGRSYIRPPVMRTNAILKNKNLRQCLALWQFIESYEEAGYSMLVQENLEKVDEAYVKELYSTLALQYLIFRYNINNEFDAESTLDTRIAEDVYNPRIVDQLTAPDKDEFNVSAEPEKIAPPPAQQRAVTLTPEDRLMLESLDVAIAAAEALTPEDEKIISHPSVPEPEAAPVYVSEEEKERKAEEERAAAEEEIRRKAIEEYVAQQEAEAAAKAEEEAKAAAEAAAKAEAEAAAKAEEEAKAAAERGADNAADTYRAPRVSAAGGRRRVVHGTAAPAVRERSAEYGAKRRAALDRLNARKRG